MPLEFIAEMLMVVVAIVVVVGMMNGCSFGNFETGETFVVGYGNWCIVQDEVVG